MITIVIPGAPRTKKNHGRIVRGKGKGKKGRPRLLPSVPWCAWRDAVLRVLRPEIAKEPTLPVRGPVSCRALFYRDRAQGDPVGFYQGLADLLEELGVVEDDVLIRDWDGTRLLVDRQHPRTEVFLTRCQDG